MGKSACPNKPFRRVSLGGAALALVLGTVLTPPQASGDEVFRSAAFLSWREASRAAYIEASIGMASLIAAQIDPAKADCIDAWYYDGMSAANDAIYATMAKYPDHHPRGVILAFIRKRCDIFQNAVR